jgi:hypothetical protein
MRGFGEHDFVGVGAEFTRLAATGLLDWGAALDANGGFHVGIRLMD